ncbi:hypothetical protein Tco_1250915 [Tanacetum coccineum]
MVVRKRSIVAIEESNSKSLGATTTMKILIGPRFDAEPVTYAMMALTGVEQDDWSIEFDAEHMHFGQDGLHGKDYKDKKKQKRSKTDKKREKNKESRARQRNQPEITAGSARHSQTKSKVNTIKSRAISDKFSKFEGLL